MKLHFKMYKPCS